MKYSLSQKPKSPGHPEQGKMWIATPQSDEQLNTEEFIKRVAGGNTQLKAQLLSNMELISYYIREFLRQGYRLNLGDLGSFYFKFDCEPYEDESAEGYNPYTHITNVKAAWSPSAAMKSLGEQLGNQGISKLKFEQVSSKKLQRKALAAAKKAETSVELN